MNKTPEERIDEFYAAAGDERPRHYIGASSIGNGCDAFLAFSLRGFPSDPPPPHVKRIFKLGNTIESMVIDDLRLSGFHVMDRDPFTGKQFAYSAHGGHVAAHADGIIELDDGSVAILEIKSMSDKKFGEFKKNGVRKSHRAYFEQIQMMMGMSGISSSVIVAYNKNNSQYHSEIVGFDEFFYLAQVARIESILRGDAGERVANDPDDWRCRGCFKRSACWEGREPERACRTCQHSAPTPDGGWWCKRHGREAEQICGEYDVWKP